MQIIILAAGSGTRMDHLTKTQHKSLLKINQEESFLSNILHKLNEYENTIIIESDIIFDDLAFKKIYFSSTKNKSIWYTRGKFNETQYGGILEASSNKKIRDIRIVERYDKIYKDYYKLLGITTIGKNEFLNFKNLINEYSNKSIQQYYLIPWIENLTLLSCYMRDLNSYQVASINTPKEYYEYLETSEKNKNIREDFSLIDIDKFYPIENYIIKRKELLQKKIKSDGYWTKPLIVDKTNHLIMDGHHRFQAAKDLGLKKIPAIKVDYDEIPIWSLKKEEIISKELVKKRALNGQIYPNKTVKHSFPFEIKLCNIPLGDLKL